MLARFLCGQRMVRREPSHSLWAKRLLPGDQYGQQALLGMQTILRLIEQHRMWSVGNLVGDLLASVRGEAVHNDCLRISFGH